MSRKIEYPKLPKVFKKVTIDENGCHNWNSAKNGDGYGYVGFAKILWRAHRLIWTLLVGEIPKGKCVLHKCDNRLCVNIEHLFIGTKAENNRDRSQKGRNRNQNGENNNIAKLTEKSVIAIRNSNNSRKELAKEFGVCRQTIDHIINRTRWDHIQSNSNLY